MTRPSPDRPSVTARVAEIRAKSQVVYWVALTYGDGQELLQGRVPEAVRAQVLNVLKRETIESQEEHAMTPDEDRRRAWYGEMARTIGDLAVTWIREAHLDPDECYPDARLAAHFGRLALGETENYPPDRPRSIGASDSGA